MANTTDMPAGPADRLTTQEKLLLSQAVYKIGAANWPLVSKLLLEHPVCEGRPAPYFQPEQCEASYVELMTSIGQNVPAPDGIKPQAKSHLRLAQTFYVARLEELKAAIEKYENNFAVLMGEINAIKSGKLDAKIQDELRAGLAKKYGKKRLDNWVPPPQVVKEEARAGPLSDKGKDEAQKAATNEGLKMQAEPPEEAKPAVEEESTTQLEIPKISLPERSATPASDLSPPPSAPAEPDEALTLEEPSTRSSKRKASVQPKGAPSSKRSTGRRASPFPTPSEPASEVLTAEVDEDEVTSTRGRRSSRRTDKRPAVQGSPAPSGRTKASSPADSKRAGSVVSRSSTPATEDRRPLRKGKRDMRDEVVTKMAREQSAAVESTRGGTEELVDEEQEEPSKATRSTRSKPDRAVSEDKEGLKVEEKEASKRGQRGSFRKGATEEKPEIESKTSPSPAPSSVAAPAKTIKFARPEVPKDVKANQKLITSLLDTIASHRDGNVFQNPVRKSDAPDYYDIIKQPMDLKTIRHRIRDGHINTIDEFERDLLLMFSNAMMYNAPGSQVYVMAQEMLKESENHVAHYRTMQHDISK